MNQGGQRVLRVDIIDGTCARRARATAFARDALPIDGVQTRMLQMRAIAETRQLHTGQPA